MVESITREDIFETPYKNIAFAVGKQEWYNTPFTQEVISRVWPELSKIEERRLGEVLTHEHGGKTYHALVCYSATSGEQLNTARILKQCLSGIKVFGDEKIALASMNSDRNFWTNDGDFERMLNVLDKTGKKIVLYSTNSS